MREGPAIRAPGWHRPSGLVDYTVRSATRRHVAMVLDYTGGNLGWAADELGVNKTTLWRWIREDNKGG